MAWRRVLDRGVVRAGIAVLVWLFGGAILYWVFGNCTEVPQWQPNGEVENVYLCPWRFPHAFYFSVQTGLSIGFGLLKEDTRISQFYSCFHILAGSSFIGGALSWFVSLMSSKHRSFLSNCEQQVMMASLALHVDTCHGFTMPQLRELLLMYPHFARAIIRRLHPDSSEASARIAEFSCSTGPRQKELANDILAEATTKIDFFMHDSLRLDDLVEMDAENAGPLRKLRIFAQEHSTFIRISAAFVCWLAIGSVFSAVADGNGFIRSVYFAIATCSTAGIVATTTVASSAHVSFVALFALVGVPLYAAMLGSFADILYQKTLARETQEKLSADFTAAEAAFLKHLSESDGHSDVSVAEYAELQLLRLGVVDRDMLNAIHQQFRQYDTAGVGRVHMSKFLHAHHLEALDQRSSQFRSENSEDVEVPGDERLFEDLNRSGQV